jgi:protein-arginine deiminase
MNHAKRPQSVMIWAVAFPCLVVAGGSPWAAESAAPTSGSPSDLQLVSDADRDGSLTERDAAAREAGGTALVMANLDDDDRDGLPDADDEHVNGPNDVRDLVPLAVVVPAGARQVRVSAGTAPVRWHRKAAEGWRHLGLHEAEIPIEVASNKTTSDELELHLESCAWAGLPASWDGRATVVVAAIDAAGETLASGTVSYEVAAVTLLPATAQVTELFVASGRYDNAGFLESLRRMLVEMDVPLTVHPTSAWQEMWMQDTMEIGTTAIPGSHMHVVLAGLRGADSFPPTLLGPDTAVAEVASSRGLGGGDAWADWYGNLEVSPATAAWPRGRVIHGRNARTAVSFHPDVVSLLAAQHAQPPVWIDTSWLMIKHVDEIVTFLPGKDGTAAILVPDPLEGLRLAGDEGASEAVASRRLEANTRIARVIDAMLTGDERAPRAGAAGDPSATGLLDLLGIDGSRVVRLPVAFDVPAAGLLEDGGVTNASTLWSNPVNALVVNGVVICGAADMPDPVRQICRERFLAAGAEAVEFIDDGIYQKNHGNVHCATNARRE